MAKTTKTTRKKKEPEVHRVLVELRVPDSHLGADANIMASSLDLVELEIDADYIPVPMEPSDALLAAEMAAQREASVVIAGMVKDDDRKALEENPRVIKVWSDATISPFYDSEVIQEEETEVETHLELVPQESFGTCPIGTCDCNSGTPKGNMATVRRYLGVDRIHNLGIRGRGIVVGVLDSGITAVGRTLKPGERPTRLIPNVIGGWPADWGTESSDWGYHGNMCSTDVLGMAPEARIYDLRISGGSSPATVGNALQAFQWAINRFRRDGTPHILSNSWGIFQRSWYRDYAENPEHPFTRKVVEAINTGIIVLFAAGNCGGTCPDGRCGSENGPGKSIWGANGHPFVMTVGAANTRGQFIGYSSQGPAALDPYKPDFLSISHFTGYFRSDSGTSAATPIAAGVVALFKQRNPRASQFDIKAGLKLTARDMGTAGWDQHAGSGIINAWTAFNHPRVRGTRPPTQRPFTGVQFRGTLRPNQTARWFTFNWPAHWHVFWHAMSLTSGTKIRWNVRTERANDNYITYWISITNLSNRSARVEGRYAVLGSN
ncbi:S8 family peptidase [Poritiphilus flavus]|uniref:S8 family peptidase n=1 Tax=Poritiphilus flavus TaxID=2697053 RepID=UPI001EEB0DC3|nr:S8/S53 family peptidase [Poritiphilus flavus]